MIGDFNVNPGDVLSILVGQSPGVCNYPISYPEVEVVLLLLLEIII